MRIDLTLVEAKVVDEVLTGASASACERAKLGEMSEETRAMFRLKIVVCETIRSKLEKAQSRAAKKQG